MPTPYHRRRELTLREQLPAIGAAMAVGLAAFYVARILLQRTPLVDPAVPPPGRAPGRALPPAPPARARPTAR